MKKLNLSLLSLLILTCSVFTFQNSLAADDNNDGPTEECLTCTNEDGCSFGTCNDSDSSEYPS